MGMVEQDGGRGGGNTSGRIYRCVRALQTPKSLLEDTSDHGTEQVLNVRAGVVDRPGMCRQAAILMK